MAAPHMAAAAAAAGAAHHLGACLCSTPALPDEQPRIPVYWDSKSVQYGFRRNLRATQYTDKLLSGNAPDMDLFHI